MVYIIPDDLRQETLKSYAADIPIDRAQAGDAVLTAAIAELSEQFDRWTHDHFEPESAITVYEDGDGSRTLKTRKRIRAITEVATLALDGSWQVQLASVYRVESSLNASGIHASGDPDTDGIEILPAQWLANTYNMAGSWPWGNVWPLGTQNVRLKGDFSWATTPDRVKRAVAMLTWARFQYGNPDIRRAVAFTNIEGSVGGSGMGAQSQIAPSEPSGIPIVDEIIADYCRDAPALIL